MAVRFVLHAFISYELVLQAPVLENLANLRHTDQIEFVNLTS